MTASTSPDTVNNFGLIAQCHRVPPNVRNSPAINCLRLSDNGFVAFVSTVTILGILFLFANSRNTSMITFCCSMGSPPVKHNITGCCVTGCVNLPSGLYVLVFSFTKRSASSVISTSCAKFLYLMDQEYDESHPVDHTGS